MANFCQSCGHPVRQEKATWVHYDEHITHTVSLLVDNEIMREYRQLQRTPSTRYILFYGYIDHAKQVYRVRDACWKDMDALFDILMSPDTSDDTRLELLRIASGHGASMWLKDNGPIIPTLVKMYARRDELSYMMSGYLEWLVITHGYPLR